MSDDEANKVRLDNLLDRLSKMENRIERLETTLSGYVRYVVLSAFAVAGAVMWEPVQRVLEAAR